jgi:hypothetical protein
MGRLRFPVLTGLLSLLTTVGIGSAGYAIRVVETMTIERGETAEFVFLDTSDNLHTIQATDDDGDGTVRFSYDTAGVALGGHHLSSCAIMIWILFTDEGSGIVFPLLGTDQGEPLLTAPLTFPTSPFPELSLGQQFTVVDGMIDGLAGLSVHEELGLSIEELLRADLSTLPKYTGPARVFGLIVYQFVPEPASIALLMLGSASLLAGPRRRG